MSFTWDTMTFVNLVLCIIILIFGLLGWRRSHKTFPLYVGIAFCLFGISHLATLLGLKSQLEIPMIIVRTLAYLIVAFTLYQTAFRK